MRVKLTHVRLLDPSSGRDEVGEICLIEGRVAPDDGGAFTVQNGEGAWVIPALVDLVATGVDPDKDGQSAQAGGFGVVLGTPGSRAMTGVGALAAPLTLGCEGRELSDVGAAVFDGALALSNGRTAVTDAGVLLQALRYAARFERPVLLRPATEGLELGPVRQGSLSMELGLRGTPPESEVLGVWTAALLAVRAGARVHLTHIWSREGVQAVTEAIEQGLPVTASTTVGQLCLPIERLADVGYSGQWNLGCVVGDAEDRAALAEGLRRGVLSAVASDHRRRTPVAYTAPFTDAEGGGDHLEHCWGQVLGVLGPDTAVRVLSIGPAQLLGLPVGLTVGAAVALVQPDSGRNPPVDQSDMHPWAPRGSNGRIRLMHPQRVPFELDA